MYILNPSSSDPNVAQNVDQTVWVAKFPATGLNMSCLWNFENSLPTNKRAQLQTQVIGSDQNFVQEKFNHLHKFSRFVNPGTTKTTSGARTQFYLTGEGRAYRMEIRATACKFEAGACRVDQSLVSNFPFSVIKEF